MFYNLKQFSKESLLSYIADCHCVDEYTLQERDIDTKNKADIVDAIECYGWAADCFDYCRA